MCTHARAQENRQRGRGRAEGRGLDSDNNGNDNERANQTIGKLAQPLLLPQGRCEMAWTEWGRSDGKLAWPGENGAEVMGDCQLRLD